MWEGAFPFGEFGETGGSVAAWEGRAGWSAGLADPYGERVRAEHRRYLLF